jgi:hypothetical protein
MLPTVWVLILSEHGDEGYSIVQVFSSFAVAESFVTTRYCAWDRRTQTYWQNNISWLSLIELEVRTDILFPFEV